MFLRASAVDFRLEAQDFSVAAIERRRFANGSACLLQVATHLSLLCRTHELIDASLHAADIGELLLKLSYRRTAGINVARFFEVALRTVKLLFLDRAFNADADIPDLLDPAALIEKSFELKFLAISGRILGIDAKDTADQLKRERCLLPVYSGIDFEQTLVHILRLHRILNAGKFEQKLFSCLIAPELLFANRFRNHFLQSGRQVSDVLTERECGIITHQLAVSHRQLIAIGRVRHNAAGQQFIENNAHGEDVAPWRAPLHKVLRRHVRQAAGDRLALRLARLTLRNAEIDQLYNG